MYGGPAWYDHFAGLFTFIPTTPAVASSFERVASIPVPVTVAGDSIRPVAFTTVTTCSVAEAPAGSVAMLQVLVDPTNVPRDGGRTLTKVRPVPSVSATAMSRAIPGPEFLSVSVKTTVVFRTGFAADEVLVRVSPASTGVTDRLAALFPASGSGWSALEMVAEIA